MFLTLVSTILFSWVVRADLDDVPVIVNVQEPNIVRCPKVAIPGYPTHYLASVGSDILVFQCPQYSVFNDKVCGCVLQYIALPTLPSFITRKPTTTTTTTPPPPPPPPPTTSTTTTTTTTTPATTTTHVPKVTCNKIPDPNNPAKYAEEIYGHGHVTRRCPAGTIFMAETCECETDTRPKKRKGLCDGCKFDRGVGYNEHFTRCDKYVICYPDPRNQSKLIGVIRHCDVGEYWDQELMTCISTVEAYCENDPCSMDPLLKMYSYEGSCRGYWTCRYGVSIGHCCPAGQGFKDHVGCAPDASCKAPCKQTGRTHAKCDKIAVQTNPVQFKQRVKGHGYVTMHCAAGTVYNQTLCECQTDDRSNRNAACEKEVEMNFTAGVTSTVNNRVHVGAVNVSHDNGSACFHGGSALIIPRFSNAIIGENLEILLQYKLNYVPGTRHSEKLQALIYNGDCGPDASIAVTVTPSRTVFGLQNSNNMSQTLELNSYEKNYNWRTARFTLRNGVMSLQQDGLAKQTYLPGSIAKSICGLKIGWGKGFESFQGCIKELSISFCTT